MADRLLGVFGKREAETVAAKIIDRVWPQPYRPFKLSDLKLDDDELHEGWGEVLIRYDWIVAVNGSRFMATRRFWNRILVDR